MTPKKEYHQSRVSPFPDKNAKLTAEQRFVNLEHDMVSQGDCLRELVDQNNKYASYLDKRMQIERESHLFWLDIRKRLATAGIIGAIGLIGSATPNGWDTPDQKMDYDSKTGTWSITVDLIDGDIKFRKNDGWAWNLGGTHDNLTQGGDNLSVSAGNYTITLTIINDATGTCTIVKN